MQKLEEAVTCFRRLVQLKPEFEIGHANLAFCLKRLGQHKEALDCYRRAYQLAPSNPTVLSQFVAHLQQLCLWDRLEEHAQRVIETVALCAIRGSAIAVDPFGFLGLPIPTTADQHRQCAGLWLKRIMGNATSQAHGDALTSHRAIGTSSKLTIGYLSADFHEHATAYLIAELIEKHNRDRFKVIGYSYGPDDSSAMRSRLANAFDQFVDARNLSFAAAAQRIQKDQVDILVDLKGFTRNARTQIMALRPAPIQVNYLGYPGTMAAPFIDYILVDDFVVPSDQQPYFAERLVHLPGCYQVNDSQRRIADRTPPRAKCGLPEQGLVFCCFNQSWKITPAIFAVWMRLLKAVPDSVLWVLQDNTLATANLRKEAQARGVSPERLVFATHLPLAEHLARHRLADLFLDTFPYNAHTTASDALWAGCPVLTVTGQTFPSRVAGSLLRALGLSELITGGLQQYEETALRLAKDSESLGRLRARLEANRKTSSLFDGGQFARNLEKAYGKMWEIYTSGAAARAFA
jgi:predicted O-linked N-acetylglucosamine transferase (SPINDLY family)